MFQQECDQPDMPAGDRPMEGQLVPALGVHQAGIVLQQAARGGLVPLSGRLEHRPDIVPCQGLNTINVTRSLHRVGLSPGACREFGGRTSSG